jgi:Putative zinc-finger
MTRHVSAEKLARSRDGDLSRAAARRVTAHLAGCPRCRADADALAGLPALLAATQLPPMPDHLAARIETALATESAHRAAGAPERPPARRRARRRSGLPRWVVTDEQARRHARRPGPARRILATAAVVAVIGGGGYALVATVGWNSGSTSSTASGSSGSRSDAGPATGPPGSAPAARPSGPGLNAPAVRSGGVLPAPAGTPDFGPVVQYRHDGRAGRFTPVRTSTDYLAADLGPQSSATLARVRSPGPAGTVGPGHTSAGQGATGGGVSGGASGAFSTATLARLPGCIGRVAGGQSVLLVDLATFQGAPAIIIVTAPPGSATGNQVWAVAAGCSSSGARVLAHRQLPPQPAP